MRKLILLVMSLAMLAPVAAAVALAQTESEESIQGSVTSVSGAVVLVEEEPNGESGSEKGYFTVTGETEILRQQGEALVPAALDDLEVGELVVATYAGPVLESFPTQGTAGSIVILGEGYEGGFVDDDEVRCLLPEGCGPDVLPEETGTGAVQYGNAA